MDETWKDQSKIDWIIIKDDSQQICTYPKSTKETPEQGIIYVQN